MEKHCDGANELQDGGGVRAAEAAVAYPVMKRKVIVSQAVDEDLYKVPQPPMYEKPRKVYIYIYTTYKETPRIGKAIYLPGPTQELIPLVGK